MGTLIPIEEHPKIRVLQAKKQQNHVPMLLTKFLEILESIASAFITLHHRFPPQVSHLLAVYFSIMNLEQSVKDLQTQNAKFQDLILNLSKGQDELKALLTKNKKKKSKKILRKRLRPILQLRDAEASED